MFEGLLQPMHLLLVLLILVVLFGPQKLPQLGKSLGEGIREFRDATNPPKGQQREVTPDAGEPTEISQ